MESVSARRKKQDIIQRRSNPTVMIQRNSMDPIHEIKGNPGYQGYQHQTPQQQQNMAGGASFHQRNKNTFSSFPRDSVSDITTPGSEAHIHEMKKINNNTKSHPHLNSMAKQSLSSKETSIIRPDEQRQNAPTTVNNHGNNSKKGSFRIAPEGDIHHYQRHHPSTARAMSSPYYNHNEVVGGGNSTLSSSVSNLSTVMGISTGGAKNNWLIRPTPNQRKPPLNKKTSAGSDKNHQSNSSMGPKDGRGTSGHSKDPSTDNGYYVDGQQQKTYKNLSNQEDMGAFSEINQGERTNRKRRDVKINNPHRQASSSSPGKSPSRRYTHEEPGLLQRRVLYTEKQVKLVDEFKKAMSRDMMKYRAEIFGQLNDRCKVIEERISDLTQSINVQKIHIEKLERETKLNMEKLQSDIKNQAAAFSTSLKNLEQKIDSGAMIFSGSQTSGFRDLSDQMKNHFFSGILTITMLAWGLCDGVYSLFSNIFNGKKRRDLSESSIAPATASSLLQRSSSIFTHGSTKLRSSSARNSHYHGRDVDIGGGIRESNTGFGARRADVNSTGGTADLFLSNTSTKNRAVPFGGRQWTQQR
eukprot:jgi/Bigna1/130926/aug1.12_g5634